jgi:hypothetical protein
MKHIVRAAAIFLCLSFCVPAWPQNAPLSEKPARFGGAGEGPALPVDELTALASLYEAYCYGLDYSAQNTSAAIDFPYGWLRENDLIDPYLASDAPGLRSFVLPQSVVEEFARCFSNRHLPLGEQYALNYSAILSPTTRSS